MSKIQRALISVSDKSGVADFALKLHECGVEILSTGGTAKLLEEKGIPVTPVSQATGFPEMMDGRVKTLHPKIHGAILGRRDVPEHMEAMKTHGIQAIDLVVVNLYPFEQAVAKEDCDLATAIENIDIGGPSMVRSAAKNFNDVTIAVNPEDYEIILAEMKENGGATRRETRMRLCRDAYAHTARYDSLISAYLTEQLEEETSFPPLLLPAFEKVQDLRYGENPHQSAAFYREPSPRSADIVSAKQLQGKELSYNNILDLNAAWELTVEFEAPAAVIIKHTNPCGVALDEGLIQAFIKARETDPTSAFGGIIGLNREVSAELAEEITKNFVEAVIAPGFSSEALAIFSAKKNVRLMAMPAVNSPRPVRDFDYKRVGGGLLVQERDGVVYGPDELKTATKIQPDAQMLEDLKFAWVVAKHVKSNAIVYAKNRETLGVGAGQMSRVDSAKIAVSKANKSLENCVMASDAFFPFRDSIDTAAECGVKAIVQPGGSIRDDEVIQAADEHDISMVFTGMRHFRH